MKVESVRYMLLAQDMDRAVRFWRDVEGFAVREQSPYWSELTGAGAWLALHHGHDGSRNPTGVSLDVDDIQAAAREIEQGGGSIVDPPHEGNPPGLWLADVADTEGNVFMLAQDSRSGA